MISPCAMTFTRTLPYIYSYTADNGCRDSAVMYALLRLRGEARTLKLEKKASMKRLSWLLMGWVLASNKSCYEVKLTFVVGRSSRVDSAVQSISAGVRRPGQRARRAALTSWAIYNVY